MQQHLGRLEGVDRVEVSLLGGKVAILPKADGRLDPRKILKATFDSGVTVVEMAVTATGWIEKNADGGLSLRVGGDETYRILPGPLARELEAAAGRSATVRGLLYRKPTRKGKKLEPGDLPLELLEIAGKE